MIKGIDGYPMDFSGDQNALDIFLTFAKNCLLLPVSWARNPENTPIEITRFKPKEDELYAAALCLFYAGTLNINSLFKQGITIDAENTRLRDLVEVLTKKELAVNGIRDALKSYQENNMDSTSEYFPDIPATADMMLDLYNSVVLLAMGMRVDNPGMLIQLKRQIDRLEAQLAKAQHPVTDPQVKALFDGWQGIPLIVKIPGHDNLYMKNPKWPHPTGMGFWLNDAIECLKKNGVGEKPRYKKLSEYIRKADGSKYKNLQGAMKTW